MIFVHCLIAVVFMLITMNFPQYLPLFLSVILFILALFAALISPSFSCDFRITHNAQTACFIVCSLIFSIVVIALTIFCAVTTSPFSWTWLALNCFHILFALTCKVKAFMLSALCYTHRWIDHINLILLVSFSEHFTQSFIIRSSPCDTLDLLCAVFGF